MLIPDGVSIAEMEENRSICQHARLERAAAAQTLILGQNGARPLRNKTLNTRDSSKSR